jgi:tol-pal system protein YbgF
MRAHCRLHAGLAIVLLPLAAACVMPDEISKLQKDVVDVQQQLRRVETNQTSLESQLAEMESTAGTEDDGVSREEMADVRLRLEQFSRQMAILSERMSDVDQRLDRYSSQDVRQTRPLTNSSLTVPPGEPPFGEDVSPSATEPASPAPGTEAFPDPEALYNTAYADFSKGNYALAISGFREYQQRFPASALADNALYWIAECHFSQGAFGTAVDALDDLLARYPDSDKAPAANLKKALAFQEQNQIGQAIIQYRYVVSAFPGTDEARLARDKLSGLGASPH